MDDVIAYTIGSFWCCLDCVEALGQDDELEPCRSSELLADTSYCCDSCGGVIRVVG